MHILSCQTHNQYEVEDAQYALQKQFGCFNHRVVSLVADKLEQQWLLEVHFWQWRSQAGGTLGHVP